ncbi:hypothetical protein PHYPSEUDO_011620 [Phytophthora pseudosyringae]|uniref:Uncharacterized protein n=1 Tax=Phytophthora pseudosyringae TaxID=221518 RepID=A0A8T1VB20_9STRA|nr:hypothetical protein PHYPSEUDO_011620 [Phytophthora pseudosyringae]
MSPDASQHRSRLPSQPAAECKDSQARRTTHNANGSSAAVVSSAGAQPESSKISPARCELSIQFTSVHTSHPQRKIQSSAIPPPVWRTPRPRRGTATSSRGHSEVKCVGRLEKAEELRFPFFGLLSAGFAILSQVDRARTRPKGKPSRPSLLHSAFVRAQQETTSALREVTARASLKQETARKLLAAEEDTSLGSAAGSAFYESSESCVDLTQHPTHWVVPKRQSSRQSREKTWR